jgi:hypothetical protein
VQVTNSVGETAIATARLTVSLPPRNAVVSGYVQRCGGPAPGRCFVSTLTVCQTPKRCVRTDRVEVLDARGRRVAVTNLKHARFSFRLTPGDYTIELLGDGEHIHGRVLQRRHVTARAHRVATVRFRFAVP